MKGGTSWLFLLVCFFVQISSVFAQGITENKYVSIDEVPGSFKSNENEASDEVAPILLEGINHGYALSRNIVYSELMGLSHLESINFERIILRRGNLYFSGRGGVGMVEFLMNPGTDESNGSTRGLNCGINTPVWFPLSINALYGSNKNYLESNVGMTFSTQPNYPFFPSAGLGYRHQAAQQGLFFRVNCYAMYTFVNDKISLRPGISLGYGFN